ncbi:MAG: hypothetical protein M1820_003389 [Bogoriella megaspora]|nr:MAG: hypothetical protein M1820_003389 [Bogoriella megaspora]
MAPPITSRVQHVMTPFGMGIALNVAVGLTLVVVFRKWPVDPSVAVGTHVVVATGGLVIINAVRAFGATGTRSVKEASATSEVIKDEEHHEDQGVTATPQQEEFGDPSVLMEDLRLCEMLMQARFADLGLFEEMVTRTPTHRPPQQSDTAIMETHDSTTSRGLNPEAEPFMFVPDTHTDDTISSRANFSSSPPPTLTNASSSGGWSQSPTSSTDVFTQASQHADTGSLIINSPPSTQGSATEEAQPLARQPEPEETSSRFDSPYIKALNNFLATRAKDFSRPVSGLENSTKAAQQKYEETQNTRPSQDQRLQPVGSRAIATLPSARPRHPLLYNAVGPRRLTPEQLQKLEDAGVMKER